MSEMVERGARALCEAKLWPGAWENETKGNREEWRMLARAMLRSMREPTESMVEAAYEDHDTKSAADDSNKDFAASCYRAMIDAALGDGK
jgi:hypothetical protein